MCHSTKNLHLLQSTRATQILLTCWCTKLQHVHTHMHTYTHIPLWCELQSKAERNHCLQSGLGGSFVWLTEGGVLAIYDIFSPTPLNISTAAWQACPASGSILSTCTALFHLKQKQNIVTVGLLEQILALEYNSYWELINIGMLKSLFECVCYYSWISSWPVIYPFCAFRSPDAHWFCSATLSFQLQPPG